MLKIWNSSINYRNKILNLLFINRQSTSNIWFVEKYAPFDSRIFPSAAILNLISRGIVLKHAGLILFLELDVSSASVSSFKIYGPRLLAQRGIGGKFIQTKKDDLSNKSTTVPLFHFPTNSVNNGKNESAIMRFFSSWTKSLDFSREELQTWK